jgi:DNA topoisomerase-2
MKMVDVAEKYQKKTQREHVLLRPGTYMGNIYDVTESIYILDSTSSMVFESITYNTGILKMFDEILMNAVDHAREFSEVTLIKVNVTNNNIIILNNGPGIPIIKHQEHNVYIPELIFSHFLTSSNYDDSQKRLKAGMNGLGAKITSTFSKRFEVETQWKNQHYVQVFRDNLSIIEDPKILKNKRRTDFTKITFEPDCERFGTSTITDDTIRVLCKRTYDATAWTNGRVKIYFNDTKLNINSFASYIDLYLDPNQHKEKVIVQTDRWKVGVCSSIRGEFVQISFVNGVQTHQGGTHVTNVLQPILKRLVNKISKKHPNIRQKLIKDHLMIFVFAEIENPEFKSQAKEELTTRKEQFGSTFEFDEASLKSIEKLQCVHNIIEVLKLQETKSLTTTDGKKKSKLFHEKLDDANKAGTKESSKCTLILTEGDSAKTFATTGISQIGRDYYGIFPLKGKLLNVRNATMKQLVNNEEIKSLKKILGLQNGKSFKDLESLKRSMRYGRVCLLTDADVDAMHIEGLIINFFHYFWPQLISEDTFVVSLSTPVVKAKPKSTKDPILEFYDLPSFDSWIQNLSEIQSKKYKIKYYKGLGTSAPEEAKLAFKDFEQKLLIYDKANEQDSDSIVLAFHKDLVGRRQEWIQEATGKSLALQIRGRLRISDFIHQGLVQFSIANCRRAIPNIMDGFKPSQRKVLYGILKKKAWDEIKVDQIRGYIAEQTMYAHGDESLNKTIIAMSQDFIGSNNINLLSPCGAFGSRLEGGKDAASPRYISTKLNNIVKHIFHSSDTGILIYLNESGELVEPEYYVPVLPMILVNGSSGIGTGFCTDIPPHNPKVLCEILLEMLNNNNNTLTEFSFSPWVRGFTGTIHVNTSTSYTSIGKWYRKNDTTITIIELPLFVWTQDYKQFLNGLVENEIIEDYYDSTTESSIHFDLIAPRLLLEEWIVEQKVETILNLRARHKINLTCFDSKNQLRKYESTTEILYEFFEIRLTFYQKRHDFLVNEISTEIDSFTNKRRFIQLVMDEDLIIFKQNKESIEEQLREYGFPMHDQSYDYLLDLPLHHFTQTHADQLTKKLEDLQISLETFLKKTAKDLWRDDLLMLLSQMK